MAVSDVFKGLTFGGINSLDYGVYITGEAVYNAPERAVEVVAIPGRNGAIPIDQGRWENIEVIYPAGTFGQTQAEFAQAMSRFRNAILSQIGYQRLTDEYHPTEYREAMYVSGLEVAPANNSKAGEFEIIFNCKPQRWLTSGEDQITLSGHSATVTNPTLYPSKPLLMADGYGGISFNGYNISLNHPYRGDVMIAGPKIYTSATRDAYGNETGDPSAVANSGDTITIGKTTLQWQIEIYQLDYGDERITGCTVSSDSGTAVGTTRVLSIKDNVVRLSTSIDALTFNYTAMGSWTYKTHTASLSFKLYTNGSTVTKTVKLVFEIGYYVDDGPSDVSVLWDVSSWDMSTLGNVIQGLVTTISTTGVKINSTEFILGTPTYIDTELGICYKIVSNKRVSLDAYVDLGSNLPELKPGSNTVTTDNTITGLSIIPRWWQL